MIYFYPLALVHGCMSVGGGDRTVEVQRKWWRGVEEEGEEGTRRIRPMLSHAGSTISLLFLLSLFSSPYSLLLSLLSLLSLRSSHLLALVLSPLPPSPLLSLLSLPLPPSPLLSSAVSRWGSPGFSSYNGKTPAHTSSKSAARPMRRAASPAPTAATVQNRGRSR